MIALETEPKRAWYYYVYMESSKDLTVRFLRFIERYTKTDMVYIAKGSFWLTLVQVAVVGTGFLLSVAYANLMDPSEYGVYRYFLSVFAILTLTTLPGTFSSYLQAAAREHEGDFMRVLKAKIQWGVIGAAISFALGAYYFINDNTPLTIGFLVLGIFLPFMDPFSLYDSLFQGRKRFDLGARYTIIEQIVSSGAVFIALFVAPSALTILIVYCAAWTLSRLCVLVYVYAKHPPNTSGEPQTIRYGMHLTVMSVIPVVSQYIDRILVFHALGPAALAGLNFAITIPDQMKSYFKSLQGLALPKLSASNGSEVKKGIGRGILWLSALLLIAVVAYILIAPLFFSILFSRYVGFVLFSQVYALSVLFTGAVLPSLALQAREAKKELYQYTIGRSVFQIGAIALFFYFWGLWGIIAARIASDLFTLLLGLFLVRKSG